ncbi:electron carrier/ protein disulfide oxidoreductase [Anaeramoeba flamelloides]|uniref:Electron carrier/ protein disulfide oxidoreductase n=1 Tax=Anaeramoeba flamelloides TaxID=1746091 RepID=A0ABQ8XAS3_9EUKA|nr:electron carrier/ protein disulfide oxidoreductase [Anaeramoeba flamelloides]
MGNLEQTVSKKQNFFNEKALQKRLQTPKPLLVVNSHFQIIRFSEGALSVFGIDDQKTNKYSILDLSQPVQRLYSSKPRACIEIVMKDLEENPTDDFIWEAKSKEEQVLWYSVKIQPAWSELQQCIFILDLLPIQEPAELLKSLTEIENLNNAITFFSDKKNSTDVDTLSLQISNLESLLEEKTDKNLKLKKEQINMKKEITRLKKEAKLNKKKKKLDEKNKNKNKNKKNNDNTNNSNTEDKKKEQKNDKGEKILKQLKHEIKKLKFKIDQVEKQDDSQTYVRNLNILKSKQKLQAKDKKELHLEIEEVELKIKKTQKKIRKREKEIEEIGNSEDYEEQNKKIEKMKKKLHKIKENYDKVKEKIKSVHVDQDLKKELDTVTIELQKTKQKNNQLRLNIANLQNNPQNQSEGSHSEQSELEFLSDFVSEDESIKSKIDQISDGDLSSGSKSTNQTRIVKETINKKEKSKQANVPEWITNKTMPTFEQIFSHPVAFEYYKEFLAYQFNVGPLLFYLEVANFKEYYLRTIHQLNSAQTRQRNQSGNNSCSDSTTEPEMDEQKFNSKYRFRYLNTWIFDIIKMFIKPDSTFELDIDIELRSEVIKSAIAEDNVNIFDEIHEIIYQDLSGSGFELFKNSQLFNELKNHLSNPKKAKHLNIRKGAFIYNEKIMKTLNSSINYEGKPIKNPCRYAESLMESLIDMINGSYSISNEQIDCEKLKQSVSFRRFEFSTCKLQTIDIGKIQELNNQQKISFLINLYNTLALYSIILNGPPSDATSYKAFLNNSMFDISGSIHSLSDIMKMLMPSSSSINQNKNNTNWNVIAITTKDPRIHFSLINLEGLTPFIKVFYSEKINHQLKLASLAFIKRNILFDEKSKIVLIPRLFKIFSTDFGNSIKQLKAWIWKHGDIKSNPKKFTLKVVKDPKFTGKISFTPEYELLD